MSHQSRQAKAAEREKQDHYAISEEKTRTARRLDSLGFSKRADEIRLQAQEHAAIAVRMETCPRIPRKR